MALTVVWEKCAVDRPRKDGTVDSVVLKRGEDLPDYVSDFLRATLVMIGAVRDLGAAVQIVEAANEADFADEPPPPILPAEVPPPAGTGQPGSATPASGPEAELTKPSVGDNKDAWESYAVGKGYMSQTEAESMTKVKLMAEVNKRESA